MSSLFRSVLIKLNLTKNIKENRILHLLVILLILAANDYASLKWLHIKDYHKRPLGAV